MIKTQSSNPGVVSLADFMATFADITHQKLPEDAAPDSFNFWPLVNGSSKVERPGIIHHSINGMFAIRQGKWKFIDGKGSGGWSAADPNDSAPGQLYDMIADEAETNNLYNTYPEVVKHLKELLQLQKEQGFSISKLLD
jgi:arylsulfatase A-like enzyme